MRRKDFGKVLEKFGLPYVFWEFDEEDELPELPYLVYYDIAPTIHYADNKPYYFSNKYVVELYTEKRKDDELCERLEAFFIAQEWNFIHEPDYIPEEDLFREYYEIITF